MNAVRLICDSSYDSEDAFLGSVTSMNQKQIICIREHVDTHDVAASVRRS